MLANPKLNKSRCTKSIQNVTKEDINETEKMNVLKNQGKGQGESYSGFGMCYRKIDQYRKRQKALYKENFRQLNASTNPLVNAAMENQLERTKDGDDR